MQHIYTIFVYHDRDDGQNNHDHDHGLDFDPDPHHHTVVYPSPSPYLVPHRTSSCDRPYRIDRNHLDPASHLSPSADQGSIRDGILFEAPVVFLALSTLHHR